MPRCSIEQIQALVDFPIHGFSNLPEGFTFIGATGGMEVVILMYEGERGALNLIQSPAIQDDLQSWEIAADTQVEAVFIGDQPGEYIQGYWIGQGPGDPGVLYWENNNRCQTLRWQQENIRYTLIFYAYKTGNRPLLEKTDLVELAKGLASEPSKLQSPTGYLTIRQAEEMAGFRVIEPDWLPAGYNLAGASYAPDRNAICLHYRYRLESAVPTLTIFESQGWLPTIEDVKIQSSYNGQPVDIPVTIDSWAIHGAENGLATWAANGVNLGPLCGGVETSNNKVLLWRANARNFILRAVVDQFDGRGFLTNLEMQRIAENLSGISTPIISEIDFERLLSLTTLKTVSSFDVKIPTRMFLDFHFDHAAYFPVGDQGNPFTHASESDRAIFIYFGAPIGNGGFGEYAYISIFQEFGEKLPTLDELALAGGFENTIVNRQPALFQQTCWDDPLMHTVTCMHILTWFEEGAWINIEARLDKSISKEMLIAIAEGMR